jgi:hypothetical protein
MTAVLLHSYKIFLQNAIIYNSNFYPNLDSLILYYNHPSTVNFLTRVQSNSSSAIDEIFSDNSKLENDSVQPIISDFSDHEAELIRDE